MRSRAFSKSGSKAASVAVAVLAAAALYRRLQRGRYPVSGRVVLITGSSRGFGLAMAEQFARAGARVVLTARSQAELKQAKALLVERGAATPSQVLTIPCDLREASQVNELFRNIEAAWSAVEVLVNNAGVISVGPVESQSVESFEEAMRANYGSMLHCTLEALPGMLARGAGAIVNIASIGGKVAIPHLLPYSASKFACVGFSQGLQAEVARKGVRVTTVCPGLLRTGSPVHAQFTGDREKEFRWFNLGASLPGFSRDAYAAAGRVLRAVESGEIEFSITPQAALAARLAPLMPGFTTALLSLVNKYVLPPAAAGAKRPVPGRAVQGRDLEQFTTAGAKAAQHWNEDEETAQLQNAAAAAVPVKQQS